MIKKFLIALLFLTVCLHSAEARQRILVIQSLRVAPYEQTVAGFESVCHSETRRIVLSDPGGADLHQKIDEIRPDIILSIGMNALEKAKTVKNIPIIYSMVLNPQAVLSGEKNITGVSINISQEKQLETLLRIIPDTKNIGLLYSPVNTGDIAKNARDAAAKVGINLFKKKIYSSRDVPSAINEMKGKIEAFWMLPDVAVVTPETIEFLILFSLENKIPILTFSEKYVELGALMSIGIDPYDIGRQAGEMAVKILSGRDIKSIQGVDARNAVISLNLKIAKKLGISIDEKIINEARIIK
ncbi:MAG TPA: ABC transporter substrate-binding protein [Desulfobacterales bacterium]|nr:ABC transporter substrate-binding protein [Desulfobacterales bacterium]